LRNATKDGFVAWAASPDAERVHHRYSGTREPIQPSGPAPLGLPRRPNDIRLALERWEDYKQRKKEQKAEE
jgi:hypothetical protein